MRTSRASRFCWQLLYNAVLLPLLIVGVRLAAFHSAKVRETLAGHDGLWARLEVALAARDPARPLLWFHVASAGEFLQAQPVLERCAAGGAQILLTVTSVSGWRWAQRRRAELPVLAVDFLPLDTRRNAARLLALLRPAALVYTKYDLWPNLAWRAARVGVPQVLLSATLHARSWRVRSALARSFYRTLYATLAGIYAVTEADAARFRATAPGHPGVEVLGDSRVDSVLERRDRVAVPALPPFGAPAAPAAPGPRGAPGAQGERGPVLVVGSSWPADERHILPVLDEALTRHPALRIVLVPHEVDAAHLAALERAFAAHACARFSVLAAATPPWRVLLVDAVGVLAALYAHGTLAYVGGAFSTGVHSVLEPAACGAVPLFGPRHHNSPEALALVEAGLAVPIADGSTFSAALQALLADPRRCAELGARARAFVEARAGASQRAYERIRAQLGHAWPEHAPVGQPVASAEGA